MRRIHLLAVLVAAVALVAAVRAHATARIVNGAYTSLYPSTGVLLGGNDPDTAAIFCSGTMIGCDTFLTAAHCVCDGAGPQCQSLNPASRLVFLQHAGFFAISSITVRSDYDFPVADVAVVKLAAPVTGVRPSALNQAAPVPDTPGLIVGFGRSGGSNDDYGLKRVASVTTAACADGISDATSVCWSFNGPGGNTCNGDSGGPLFADFGSGLQVAGVTSGGSSDDCLPTDKSYDANVFHYASWIAAQGGADLGNTACGAGPQVGDGDTNIVGIVGSLSTGVPTAVHAITVPSGAGELRVALNAVDDGSDFDLFVKFGAPPTPTDHDCQANGPNQYGFCAFATPAAGTWYVLVRRWSGQGTYQVTATTLGGAPPVCGNGAREGGEACDGVDDLACPGFCGMACACEPACTASDLVVEKLRSGRSLSLRATLDATGGTYDGLDPRAAPFALVLDDGVSPVVVTVPANDPGWSGSHPERGSYKWRVSGPIAGLRRVTVKDKSLRNGVWEVKVSGRDVPGGTTLNPTAARATVSIGAGCATAAP